MAFNQCPKNFENWRLTKSSGWVDGWEDVKVDLWIVYSNQKVYTFQWLKLKSMAKTKRLCKKIWGN